MEFTRRRRTIVLVAGVILILGAVGVWSKRANFRAAHAETMRVTDGRPMHLRCVLRDRAERVTYQTTDSLRIVADLYGAAQAGPQPAIVLLHGSYRAARRHPFVRVLAERLRQEGYLVLAPDARAYGESDDPADLASSTSFDFPGDVSAAIDLLLARPDVDPERIYLLGHSFGGGVAIAAEARDPRIAKVVLNGPPRRMAERIFDEGAPDRAYFMSRWASDMQIPGPLDFDMWLPVRQALDPARYIDRFSEPGHTPLLIVDGEEEDPRDLQWLRDWHRQLAASVDYWTVPEAHHYLRTGTILRVPCYAAGPMNEFVEHVDRWLREVS
jgi:pimeloyl-ACP methyl ester carboxylesterase